MDKDNADRLYYASQQEGLWVTDNQGKDWHRLTALKEQYLAFAAQAGSALVVSTAGVTSMDREKNWRGHSLYLSYDKGETFVQLAEPQGSAIAGCRLNGLVAQRCAADEHFLYVTFASTGRRSYVLENGYSCDSGDTIDGRIVRYEICADGSICEAYKDITPVAASSACGAGIGRIAPAEPLDFGFSGIDVSAQKAGMLVCTTIVKDDGDSVFRSFDYGESWQQILYDLQDGEISFRAPYMRPVCNGGHSLIHWLSDIKINPFDDNEAWFNSGTGVFCTRNLKDKRKCCFTDWCDGIEETVHLNVYSMPKGEVQVIDILGDLGGFAFTALDKPCGNSFADEDGNRYITCINADFSDENPDVLVVTPRGNWTGKTKGGLILSRDEGRTFTRLAMPFGLSADLDKALKNIERPNVNSGWVAMSPDCKNIVWSVADGIDLPVERLVVSHDTGVSFSRCKVFSQSGSQKTVFYMALDEAGLWKLEYNCDTDVIKTTRLSREGDSVFRMGLGLRSPESDYYKDGKAVYLSGCIDGVYGFYRTLDEGKSYERLNTDRQMYGEINSIDGDCRVFGRFYLATGSNGVKYGEPVCSCKL